MDYRDIQDWGGLEKAHNMGVSWAKIWAIIGAVAFMALIGFAVSVYVGSKNSKMVEEKIQPDIQKIIQDSVNQKLREAGIEPIKQ